VRPERNQSRAATWPGRTSIAIAVGALVAAAAVWWFTVREPLPAAGARVALPAPPPAAPAPPSSPPQVVLPPPAVVPYPAQGTAGLSTDDPLTAYRKANVYPPTSRPLTRDQLDLLQPDRRHEVMRPDDHGAGLTYLFTADRYFVFGDQTLTATLDVRRDGKPIAVTVAQAYAVVLDPANPANRAPPRIPLAFAATGPLQAAVFAPAGLGLARQSAIGIYLEFDHGNGRQAAHFDFQYTPDHGVPARFTGAFREAIDAGSLAIHAGIEIATPGHYVVDCNLFDAADEPVAWSRFKGELAAGTHEADLVFFGKVLVDGNAHGPFHLGQLRGARYAPGFDPDLEQIPPFTGAYRTRAYPTDAFSDAEYDSAEKQKMLELLGQDKNHGGGAGRGSPGSGGDPPSR
jgi:hypothetical protein